jgi:hypothetical protein
MKKQLLEILEKSRKTELNFLKQLSKEDRAQPGTFEEWSAKDVLAHASFWQTFNSERVAAWAHGDELEPAPDFNDENNRIYERFADSSWEDVEAQCERSHSTSKTSLESLDEEQLMGPSEGSETTPLWQNVVGNVFSHKLLHFSEFYQQHDRNEAAGKLWSEWVGAVAGLDEDPAWQGLVHYNAACGMALAGDKKDALGALKKSLEARPSLVDWSRLDPDLAILHDTPEYRELFASEYWWKALEANPQAEALTDQYLRLFSMLRIAIDRVPGKEWRKGDSRYQRPVSLVLHLLQSIDFYSARTRGDNSGDPLYLINWQGPDSSRLPDKQTTLKYLKLCEERLANFLATADFEADEEFFPWTGSTVLSRAVYCLRHSQHHFAHLTMVMDNKGLNPPDWQ